MICEWILCLFLPRDKQSHNDLPDLKDMYFFWAPNRAFRCKSSANIAVGATVGKELLPSLLPTGTNWHVRLRAFRCNRGRG
ncbi:MAG: hypothetical protein EA358_10050 [Flavobacteriales bacterium]|nr:MAG: hypothetical protein EA358_10050 [Flavobacteriales bacterium]